MEAAIGAVTGVFTLLAFALACFVKIHKKQAESDIKLLSEVKPDKRAALVAEKWAKYVTIPQPTDEALAAKKLDEDLRLRRDQLIQQFNLYRFAIVALVIVLLASQAIALIKPTPPPTPTDCSKNTTAEVETSAKQEGDTGHPCVDELMKRIGVGTITPSQLSIVFARTDQYKVPDAYTTLREKCRGAAFDKAALGLLAKEAMARTGDSVAYNDSAEILWNQLNDHPQDFIEASLVNDATGTELKDALDLISISDATSTNPTRKTKVEELKRKYNSPQKKSESSGG